MFANLLRTTICCGLLGSAAISYAGLDRFWLLFGQDDEQTQISDCENLTHEQQQQLIQTYQSLKDEDKKFDLKKRMQWFCQLPNDQQQLMREAWQNMSSNQRNELRKKLETAIDPEERALIRQEFLMKYALDN